MGLVIVIPYDHPMLHAVRRSGAPVFGGGVLSAEIGDDHLFSRLTRCGRVEVSLGLFLGGYAFIAGWFCVWKSRRKWDDDRGVPLWKPRIGAFRSHGAIPKS